MLSDHEKIVSCLRTKSIEELTKFNFGTPSFLSSMGPSKDGIVIPNDFGADVEGDRAKRAQNAASYQVRMSTVKLHGLLAKYLTPGPLYVRSR